MQALNTKTARVAQTSQRSAGSVIALPKGSVALRIVPFQVIAHPGHQPRPGA